jgi:hypothetical protein
MFVTKLMTMSNKHDFNGYHPESTNQYQFAGQSHIKF